MTIHSHPARRGAAAPVLAHEADRRAFVRDWIARRQKKLAAGSLLGGAFLFLPMLAHAQTGQVEAATLEGVRSVTLLADGAARIVLENGQTVVVGAADVTALADGTILVSDGAAAALVEIAMAAPAPAAGGGAGAAVALGGLAAAAAAAGSGSSGSSSDPALALDPVPAMNIAGQAAGLEVTGTATRLDGEEIRVEIRDSDGEVLAEQSVEVTDGTWSTTFDDSDLLAGLEDGADYTVHVRTEDEDGPTAEAGFSTDFTAPTIEIASLDPINLDDADDFEISGSTDAEDGQEVTVTVNGTEYTATVEGGAWSVDVPAEGFGNGDDLTITADVSDAAGNPAAQAEASVLAYLPGSVTIGDLSAGDVMNAAEQGDGLTVGGMAENVDEVTVQIRAADESVVAETAASVTNGEWSASFADLSNLADDSSYTVHASVTDLAGTETTDTAGFSTDFTAPTIEIDEIGEDGVLIISELGASLEITGTTDAENGQQVTVTVDGTEYTATVEGGAWSVSAPAGDLAAGSMIDVTADVSDAAGNPAAQADASVVGYAPAVYLVGGMHIPGGAQGQIFATDEMFPDGVMAFDAGVTVENATFDDATFPSSEHPGFLFILGNPDNGAFSGVAAVTPAGEVPITEFAIPLVTFEMDVLDAGEITRIDLTTSNLTGAGSTAFIGTSDDDTLSALAGRDTALYGGAGDDTLDVSAAGSHVVIFSADTAVNGTNTVTGFTAGDGLLADGIYIAGLDHDVLRGDGWQVEFLEAGEAVGADTGLVVFTTALGGTGTAELDAALAGLTGLDDEDVFYLLAGDGTDAVLAQVTVDGGDFDIAVMAGFTGLDTAGVTEANILNFDVTGTVV